MKPVDYLGKEINVGDTIVYPARRGSSLWMRKAVVEGVVEKKARNYNNDVYTIFALRTRPVDPRTNKPMRKAGFFTSIDRCVVVS